MIMYFKLLNSVLNGIQAIYVFLKNSFQLLFFGSLVLLKPAGESPLLGSMAGGIGGSETQFLASHITHQEKFPLREQVIS